MSITTGSYALAAAAYAVLAGWLVASRLQGAFARLPAVAAAASSVAAIATMADFGGAYVLELGRNACWIVLAGAFTRSATGEELRGHLRVAAPYAAGCCALCLGPYLVWGGGRAPIADIAGAVVAGASLAAVTASYFTTMKTSRRAMRLLAGFIALQSALDLTGYCELMAGTPRIAGPAWELRGLLSATLMPLALAGIRRARPWDSRPFVSRHVVTYGAVALIIVVPSCAIWLVGRHVTTQDAWAMAALVGASYGAGTMAAIVAMASLRRRLRVFISKHFFRNKYDYRLEWLNFVRRLSGISLGDFHRGAIKAAASVFASRSGMLFVTGTDGRCECMATWAEDDRDLPLVPPLDAAGTLLRGYLSRGWIVDVKELERDPVACGHMALPEWAFDRTHVRLISPIMRCDTLVGVLVLGPPPQPFELSYEDRDLLATVGQHLAIHLAQHEADRQLAESRQFEAFNRLTSFVMHDLKNAVAQMQLAASNADRHRRNPEFVDDLVDTIGSALHRINRVIGQLRIDVGERPRRFVGVPDLARSAIARCIVREPQPVIQVEGPPSEVRADPDDLVNAIEHVIRNAQEAAGPGGRVAVAVGRSEGVAVISVSDNGPGMDAEFVRNCLFRPFYSTKGAAGMGLGAYQVRECIRALGGRVTIRTAPGAGTCFSILVPAHSTEVGDG